VRASSRPRRRLSKSAGWLPERFEPGTTIADGLRGHRNGLGLLRLVFACVVVASHAFPLGGHKVDPFLAWSGQQLESGTLAVVGFFGISGYLITKSGMRSDVLAFMWARVIRIFPAFWAMMLVSVFIVGPAIWLHLGRPLGNYWSTAPGGSLAYLRNWTLTVHQYGISDLLIGTPYGHMVNGSVFNGSIWSLSYEWHCYLVIGLLALFASRAGFRLFVPLLTAFMLVAQMARISGATNLGAVAPWLGNSLMVNLLFIFMVGSCIAVYGDKIPLDNRAGLLAVAVVLYTLRKGGFETLGVPAFCYAVLWAAACMPARLKSIGARNDYSYGIYLWSFLVEQLFATIGWWRWGYLPYLGVSLAGSVVLAWLSWHIVERPALLLKARGPGRGLAYWGALGRRLVLPGAPRVGAVPPARASGESVAALGTEVAQHLHELVGVDHAGVDDVGAHPTA
jgi:peptidoglycan/LPS O-acetylase OafA/YrhL